MLPTTSSTRSVRARACGARGPGPRADVRRAAARRCPGNRRRAGNRVRGRRGHDRAHRAPEASRLQVPPTPGPQLRGSQPHLDCRRGARRTYSTPSRRSATTQANPPPSFHTRLWLSAAGLGARALRGRCRRSRVRAVSVPVHWSTRRTRLGSGAPVFDLGLHGMAAIYRAETNCSALRCTS